jgi:hydrogenase-4 component B
MPAPGELRPARLTVEMHDLVWEFVYDPVTHAVEFLALKLNRLQFLTIRQYLSIVVGALVFLLLVLATWP